MFPDSFGSRGAQPVATIGDTAVVFPDGFGGRGAGEACGVAGHPSPGFSIRGYDAPAVADWARAQPRAGGKAPVLLGWSHGGLTTLAARALAAPGQIAGAVTFYPGCLGAPRGGAAPPSLRRLLGDADDWTPARNCERWLARGAASVTRITYPGAAHRFDGSSDAARARVLSSGRKVHLAASPRRARRRGPRSRASSPPLPDRPAPCRARFRRGAQLW